MDFLMSILVDAMVVVIGIRGTLFRGHSNTIELLLERLGLGT